MSDEGISQDIDTNDVLKILLATDIHLGYNEKDAIRGKSGHIRYTFGQCNKTFD